MRFSWQRRADREHDHRVKAEDRLRSARADWFEVEHQAANLRHQRELNGWTDTIALIFGSDKPVKQERE